MLSPPALHDHAPERLFCDLTQSWSSVGGGVGTYLKRKRAHILNNTPHRHLMILPGDRDAVEEDGRAITAWIRSPNVPFSPHYRLLLRNGAVRRLLEQFMPDVIECQDAYNLPWAALAHRDQHPETALVAGYMTDFPTVYVERPFQKALGRRIARSAGRLSYRYCGKLYRQFDAVYALSNFGGGNKLRALGVEDVFILPLGVQLDDFSPDLRDSELRRSLGLGEGDPLLIYVGRLDVEKRPDIVVEAFRQLPDSLGARLVLLGDGPFRQQFESLNDPRIVTPGFVNDRAALSRWLASSDIYVSAMPNETFGVSVIEAQASGLPVVGVSGGAMVERVRRNMGRLGPVGDSTSMAANLLEVWRSDHRAMGEAGRRHVADEFSWEHSMAVLFNQVVPAALSRRLTSAPKSLVEPLGLKARSAAV